MSVPPTELEGKDVEDLFTAVLSPSSSTTTSITPSVGSTSQLDHSHHMHGPMGPKALPHPTGRTHTHKLQLVSGERLQIIHKFKKQKYI